MRHSRCLRNRLGLALNKDLAVSPPPFYPYNGAGPVYVRIGSLVSFRKSASLFAPLSFHSTAVSRYFSAACAARVSRLSSPRFSSERNRLNYHNNYTSLRPLVNPFDTTASKAVACSGLTLSGAGYSGLKGRSLAPSNVSRQPDRIGPLLPPLQPALLTRLPL